MASNNWNSRNTYKTNANPKINMPMSENVGQRRLTFLWNISILYIIIIFIFFFWLKMIIMQSIEIFQRKFSLLCPTFSDMRMFIFGLAFVLTETASIKRNSFH